MFFLNFGALPPKSLFADVCAATERPAGACLLASGYDFAKLTRNELPSSSTLLLDPQLYLSELPVSAEDSRLWRLASHPWFQVEQVQQFDSNEQRRRDWEGGVKDTVLEQWPGRAPTGANIQSAAFTAIQAQVQLGCSFVIMPAPLLQEREQEGAPAVEWARAGVQQAAAAGYQGKLLATVALDERVINEGVFSPFGFLDSVVSQVSATRGLAGVYIVIAQQGDPKHPFQTAPQVWRAYAALCRRFRATRRLELVLANFCDVGGFACLANGASGFGTGNFQSTRRLSLAGSADGRPYPFYYAQNAVMELRPEDDLDPIVGAGEFHRIADSTPFAAPLVSALQNQGTAAGQAPWLMTINNVQTAHRHQVYRMCESLQNTLAIAQSDRKRAVADWAKAATENQAVLLSHLDRQKTRYTADASSLLAAVNA